MVNNVFLVKALQKYTYTAGEASCPDFFMNKMRNKLIGH
jgi:hypothetical protein